MDVGLLWTPLGTVVGLLGLTVAWRQLTLQKQQRSEHGGPDDHRPRNLAGLPVHIPTGQLPPTVRGRDETLRKLRRQRRSRAGNAVVLAGMGGVGKSTVAVTFADRTHCAPFSRRPPVWWVSAADMTSLIGGLITVAQQLGARRADIEALSVGAPDAADRVWALLRHAPRGWLLILDNADDPAVLIPPARNRQAADGPVHVGCVGDGTGWLRPTPRGLIVVTSRLADPAVWGRNTRILTVNPLNDDDAALVLLDRAPGAGNSAEARKLASRLGGLPLALRLVGSYLESGVALRPSFRECRQAFDEQDTGPYQLLARGVDRPTADARTLVTHTWELSLDALARGGVPQARPLMRLLCCYASAVPIPLRMLAPDRLAHLLTQPTDGKRLPTAAEAGQRLERCLHRLRLLGLIEVRHLGPDVEDRGLVVHPVVADTTRVRLLDDSFLDGKSDPGDKCILVETADEALRTIVPATAVDLMAAALSNLTVDRTDDWPIYHLLGPHLHALFQTVVPHLNHQDLGTLIDAAAATVTNLNWSGAVPASERLARAALGLLHDHPADLRIRHHLAWNVAIQGHLADAEVMLNDVLAAQQRVHGHEHPETLDTSRELAWVAAAQGRWAAAEQAYREIYRSYRRIQTDVHRTTLITRHELGWAVANQGRLREAAGQLLAVLDDRRQFLGEEHPDTLDTRHELVWISAQSGQWAAAEKAYRNLLEIYPRVLGGDHWKTLILRHELAWTIALQGRARAARRAYQEALDARRRVLGEEHPDTAETRRCLQQLRHGQSTPARHLA